ncbi:rRNA maturation RNase YbeY [Candidatus Kaiserbacteria bacterium]|nr:rRNA maturation RNase YbeY [Candidatus Kaiserbacteria bacterium]
MLRIAIRKTVRGRSPRVPFEKIARAVLPRGYQLSLVLCGDTLARTINIKYRKKKYAPNVLSFELDANEGEIFLNLHVAAREAKKLSVKYESRIALLFVHGLYHLLGFDHGKAMTSKERVTLRRFGYDVD